MAQKKFDLRNAAAFNTLVLVLGALAGVSLLGFIGISLRSGHASGEALLGVCSAIVGYLGGLVTPRAQMPLLPPDDQSSARTQSSDLPPT